jgi:hypothetical protein
VVQSLKLLCNGVERFEPHGSRPPSLTADVGYFLGSIRSRPPIYGRSTVGMVMEPSAF